MVNLVNDIRTNIMEEISGNRVVWGGGFRFLNQIAQVINGW